MLRNNQCSLVNLWEFRGMILTSIQCLRNLLHNNWDTSGDQKKFHSRKIVEIINHFRPEQKHIYTSNLKYQIILIPSWRVLGWAFIPYCSLPELEVCMEVWGFMEMIHSRSYTYIIKNVYANPSDVLDKIVTDSKILDRA